MHDRMLCSRVVLDSILAIQGSTIIYPPGFSIFRFASVLTAPFPFPAS